jgi:uncharacterized protein YjiK
MGSCVLLQRDMDMPSNTTPSFRCTVAPSTAVSIAHAAAMAVLLLGMTSCSRNEQSATDPGTPAAQSLQLITTYSLTVTEPSGLAYSQATRTLYMISDNRSEIFRIDTTGKVLGSIPVNASDIEGVAVSNSGDTLYIVEETASLLSTILLNGTKVSSVPVVVRTDPQHSLEGVTVDNAGSLVVINEKAPTMLLEFAGGVEMRRLLLTYSSDISDICYDVSGDCFWIVSDESQKVLKLSRSGALLGEWSIPVRQGEGIAFIRDRCYIVSDVDAKLYVFVKPS